MMENKFTIRRQMLLDAAKGTTLAALTGRRLLPLMLMVLALSLAFTSTAQADFEQLQVAKQMGRVVYLKAGETTPGGMVLTEPAVRLDFTEYLVNRNRDTTFTGVQIEALIDNTAGNNRSNDGEAINALGDRVIEAGFLGNNQGLARAGDEENPENPDNPAVAAHTNNTGAYRTIFDVIYIEEDLPVNPNFNGSTDRNLFPAGGISVPPTYNYDRAPVVVRYYLIVSFKDEDKGGAIFELHSQSSATEDEAGRDISNNGNKTEGGDDHDSPTMFWFPRVVSAPSACGAVEESAVNLLSSKQLLGDLSELPLHHTVDQHSDRDLRWSQINPLRSSPANLLPTGIIINTNQDVQTYGGPLGTMALDANNEEIKSGGGFYSDAWYVGRHTVAIDKYESISERLEQKYRIEQGGLREDLEYVHSITMRGGRDSLGTPDHVLLTTDQTFQQPFPGDIDRGIDGTEPMLIYNGNGSNSTDPVGVWKKDIAAGVLEAGKYNFSAYVSNIIWPGRPADSYPAKPIVQLRVNGEKVGTSVTLSVETLEEGDSWYLVQGAFETDGNEDITLEITNENNYSIFNVNGDDVTGSIAKARDGDELAIARVGLSLCSDKSDGTIDEETIDEIVNTNNGGDNTGGDNTGDSNSTDETDVESENGDHSGDETGAENDGGNENGEAEENTSGGGGGGGAIGFAFLSLLLPLAIRRRRMKA